MLYVVYSLIKILLRWLFYLFSVWLQESDLGTDFVILPGPPVGNGIDLEKLEHQKVVVDFRLTDGLADDTRHYVIQRDKSGSYEVLSTGLIDEDKVWCVCVC